jgi:hypothetical protein
MKGFLLVICLLLIFPASSRAALFDPSFNFMKLETEHFCIYYHQGLEGMAQRAATIAEEVNGKLAPLLQWQPQQKTHIVIADNSDFANGMTTVVPYNLIYLQAAPPSIASSLGEYDNWLRLLIIHEYTHVLTSDPVRGYSAVTRRIFGKVVPQGDLLNLLAFVITGPPNMLMPRWWHEGMATWAETELTSSGRGRSSYYQMLYRTAVAENRLLSLDLINGDIPYWPEGNSPYIFGSAFIQYLAGKYGQTVPGNISGQQSGRLPYFINDTPKDRLDRKDYPALYDEMLTQMTAEQRSKIALLAQRPFTNVTTMSKPAVAESAPRFSHNGKMIAFNRYDRHSQARIVVMERSGKEIASFRREDGDGTITWMPDDQGIIFSQALLSAAGNYYQDIYRYDIATKKIKRLTRRMRAAKPDLSPDGKQLAVVISSRGGENLALFTLEDLLQERETATPRLLTDYSEQRLSAPRWSPDGKSIAFTATDMNGTAALNLIEPLSARITPLLATSHTIDAPTWNPDGRSLLYSADDNGVYNIYRLTIEGKKTVPVTHLLSGAFTPDSASSDGTLVIGRYTSQGFAIGLVASKDLGSDPAPLPSVRERLYPVNKALVSADSSGKAALPAAVAYSPLPTLLPKFWLPTLIPENRSNLAVGAMTAGQDILGYHSYLARVTYGNEYRKNYFDLYYNYGRQIPVFSLAGYALPATYSNLLVAGDYSEIERGVMATGTMPLTDYIDGLTIKAGYHLRSLKRLTPSPAVTFSGKPVFEGRRDSVFAGIDYTSTLKFPWSVATEEGRNVSFKAEYYGRETGSDLETREYTAIWEEYFRLYRHHILLARISGGLAEGQQSPQSSFRLGWLTSIYNPFGLRGYSSYFSTGDRIATATGEYRFPLHYFLHGFATKPLFLDRLHGAVFVDAGEVWSKRRSFREDKLLYGAGGELRFDVTIGYWLKITPAIGYAHGFDRRLGEDQIYFNIYANL